MNKAEKFWDKQSGKFEKLVDKDEQSFNKPIEMTKKYLRNSDSVLDFACGIGTSSIRMADHVKEIQAIDISSGMIDVAQRRISEHNINNVNFIKTTIFDEQLKAESFDVITAFNILHLMEDPKKAIHRIYELLKPGGFFISETAFLGEKSFMRFIFYILSKTGKIPHLKLLKIAEFEKILADENFQIIENEKLHKSQIQSFIVAKKS